MNSVINPARSASAVVPALAMFLSLPLVAAVLQSAAPPAYLCDTYGVAEGLPENTVAAVTRTADGYLWVATQDGLARFDGLRFESFHMLDSPGLPHDNIHALAAARDGSLWVGTYNRGAAHFVRGQFHPVQGLVSPVIRAILEDRDGAVWIATRGGLNRWKNGAISVFTQKDGLAGTDVLALAEDRQGRLWIGSNGGLSLLEDGKFTAFGGQNRFAGMDVRSFAPAPDGSLWIASSQAFARLQDGFVQEWYARERLPFKGEIRSIAVSADGALWIGTFGDALQRFQAGRFDRIGADQGLPSDVIFCLRAEPDGSLWAGTSGSGLNRLRARHIRMIGAPEGLSAPDADSVLETRDGALWIGTLGQGLNRYQDGRVHKFTTADGLSSNVILSLWQSPRTGTLWVGTGDGSLNRFDGRRFQNIVLGAGKMPARIFETRDGEMWVGTTRGLYRLRDGSIERVYTTADGLPSDAVLTMIEARDGSLWLGTGSGISHYQQDRFTSYATPKPGSGYGPRVDWLYQDREGTLWLGSAGHGLGRYRNGQIFWAGSQQGLNDNVVYSGLEDGGDLWLSTNRGICRVSKAQFHALADGRISRVGVHVYDTNDGMRSNECSGDIQPSAWKRQSGELVFSCLGGAVEIDPAHLPRQSAAPATVIESAKINGRPVFPSAGETRFPPGAGELEFSYTAIDFSAPRQIQFRYQLEGVDAGWVDAGGLRTVRYTHIPPGPHRFRVAAENADGFSHEAAMDFVLMPHIWETILFKIGMVAGAILLLAAAYRWRTRLQRARQQQLERLVELRTREMNLARDEAVAASRAKSQFLANMSHEIRTPMNGVMGMISLILETDLNQPQREYVAMAHSSATTLLGLINDILDFSKIEAGKMELDTQEFSLPEFFMEVVRMHAVRAYEKKLELVVDVAPEVPARVKADRMRLGQVLNNLISNALKFTSRGEIVVSSRAGAIEAGKVDLSFAVRDTGIGMSPETIERIFQPFAQGDASTTRRFGGTGLGLTISASLIRLMAGRIQVESREGEGSTFHVTVPVDVVAGANSQSSETAALPPGNGSVLIADDNSTCRRALAGLLHRWGVETVEAAEGMEALALLRTSAPGAFRAALLDAEMPGPSGWEVAEWLASHQVSTRAIVLAPILARRKPTAAIAVLAKPVCSLSLWEALTIQCAAEAPAASGDAGRAITAPSCRPEPNVQGPRILLVEDNPVNRLFAQRLLEKKGYPVTTAVDGEAALRAFEQASFDVILMDVQMPGTDGLEATRRIRERERASGANPTPIIAMTAHAMSGDREVCLEAGMNGYVSKPVDPRELMAAILALTGAASDSPVLTTSDN